MRREGMTNSERLLQFITRTYGYQPFTTEDIYTFAEALEIKPSSIPGALNGLKKKGVLTNYGGRYTQNGRLQKVWQLTHGR